MSDDFEGSVSIPASGEPSAPPPAPVEASPAPAPVEVTPPAPDEPTVRLDVDTGELEIKSNFFEPDGKFTEPVEPVRTPPYEVPEFIEAMRNNTVDYNRLPEAARPYIENLNNNLRAALEAQRLTEHFRSLAAEPVAPPPPFQQQIQTPPPPPPPDEAKLFEENDQWAKEYAAKNLLKLNSVDDFDEFDPRHKRAWDMALLAKVEQQKALYRQATEAREQQTFQQKQFAETQEQKNRMVATMAAEMAQRMGRENFGDMLRFAKDQWLPNLPMNQYVAANKILDSYNIDLTKPLFERIYRDYTAYKQSSQPRQTPPRVAVQPPTIMAAASEPRGFASGARDARMLRNMNDDEQVEWLIKSGVVR